MLIIILVLLSQILWTVWDWKQEFDHMMFCFKHITFIPPSITFLSIAKLAGDIFLVSIAINILGLGGFYGAIGGLFMSNVMSMVFFMPNKKEKEIIKSLSLKG